MIRISYETVKIEKVGQSCPACEEYAEKYSTDPPKVAVMACEGACAKGEVARVAANIVAHELARESTVRICLGGAFTKDSGQRGLVRRANKAVAIEGCFISCSSRMMKGVLPSLKSEVVQADTLYEASLPFGVDEVPEEVIRECAWTVAEAVVKEHVLNVAAGGSHMRAATMKSRSGCCGK